MLKVLHTTTLTQHVQHNTITVKDQISWVCNDNFHFSFSFPNLHWFPFCKKILSILQRTKLEFHTVTLIEHKDSINSLHFQWGISILGHTRTWWYDNCVYMMRKYWNCYNTHLDTINFSHFFTFFAFSMYLNLPHCFIISGIFFLLSAKQ